MSNYLKSLEWRYATKKFDSSKKLSDDQLNVLLDSIQLTASSYGLQPYEVLVVENKDIRAKLSEAAWNQPQIMDAAYVLVFAANTNVDEQYLEKYMQNTAETRGLSIDDLSGFSDMIKNTVLTFPEDQKVEWAKRQAYIALGNLLSAAAVHEIDACPMEGFDPSQFNEILDLPSKNLDAAVIATIGFRSEEDEMKDAKKVRKPKNELFTKI